MNEFQRWIGDSLARSCWTPDVPRLETQDYWYVFTYADRKGKKSDYFVAEADSGVEYVSVGWTKSAIYSILNVQTKDKRFHLATPMGTDKILGEVWAVPTDLIYELDADEGNLLFTKRILVPIHAKGAKLIDAWMYVANSEWLTKGGIRTSIYKNYTHYAGEKFIDVT